MAAGCEKHGSGSGNPASAKLSKLEQSEYLSAQLVMFE